MYVDVNMFPYLYIYIYIHTFAVSTKQMEIAAPVRAPASSLVVSTREVATHIAKIPNGLQLNHIQH